jgi:hypothetical protein
VNKRRGYAKVTGRIWGLRNWISQPTQFGVSALVRPGCRSTGPSRTEKEVIGRENYSNDMFDFRTIALRL